MHISASELAAHNQQFLKRRGRLRLFCTRDATVVVRSGDAAYQVSQIGFMSDGSIMVQWPYLAVKQGVVAAVSLPEGATSAEFPLHETGRFTSQLVKFVHHKSGAAHFSKTKYTTNEVRRQSFPLDGPIGRIFIQSVQYPARFKPLTRLKSGRLYIEFDLGSPAPDAVELRGEWRRKDSLVANVDRKRASVGPETVWMHRQVGVVEPVCFFAPPLDCPIREYALCVSCSAVQLPAGAASPGAILIGAFDAHEVPDTVIAPVTRLGGALVAMYPTDSPEETVARIGTIDLSR